MALVPSYQHLRQWDDDGSPPYDVFVEISSVTGVEAVWYDSGWQCVERTGCSRFCPMCMHYDTYEHSRWYNVFVYNKAGEFWAHNREQRHRNHFLYHSQQKPRWIRFPTHPVQGLRGSHLYAVAL